MRYHMIRTDDMLNGDGLRVVLFVALCPHRCEGCHNPETWNGDGSKEFGDEERQQIYKELDKDYISGITLSGGDPLHVSNRDDIYDLIMDIKDKYPDKTIWMYTGYSWEFILKHDDMLDIVRMCDVVVDGRFRKDLADVNYPWAGSTNQRVIYVKDSLRSGLVISHILVQ